MSFATSVGITLFFNGMKPYSLSGHGTRFRRFRETASLARMKPIFLIAIAWDDAFGRKLEVCSQVSPNVISSYGKD